MVLIASDHAGFELKTQIIKYLEKNYINFKDLGPNNYEKSDSYVDYAKKACNLFSSDDKIILVCGSGVGMSIVANRYKGIRAVLGYSTKIVEKSVQHNNSNCLCLGQNFTTKHKAIKMIKVFLNTKFEGGRHSQRVENIDKN